MPLLSNVVAFFPFYQLFRVGFEALFMQASCLWGFLLTGSIVFFWRGFCPALQLVCFGFYGLSISFFMYFGIVRCLGSHGMSTETLGSDVLCELTCFFFRVFLVKLYELCGLA